MKSKISLFVGLALLSLSASAVQKNTIVLDNGSTATVLSQAGQDISYVKTQRLTQMEVTSRLRLKFSMATDSLKQPLANAYRFINALFQ